MKGEIRILHLRKTEMVRAETKNDAVVGKAPGSIKIVVDRYRL